MSKNLNLNTNFQLRPCPYCEGQGWLFPFQVKKNKKKLLICEECNSVWFMGNTISIENCIDVNSYIREIYSEIVFKNDNDINCYIEELRYETMLENVSNFGCFPMDANNIFIYFSNAFFIGECKMSEACFMEFIIKYTYSSPLNIINPFASKSHTRIIRYNLRFFGDYEFFIQTLPDISQYSHIVTQGLSQTYRSPCGVRFQHIVYDIIEKKFYLYQIKGLKGNYFFDEATILHNIFYPDYKI
jgi:hypothetical protein